MPLRTIGTLLLLTSFALAQQTVPPPTPPAQPRQLTPQQQPKPEIHPIPAQTPRPEQPSKPEAPKPEKPLPEQARSAEENARVAHITVYHDAQHPSALEVPIGR